MPKNDITRSRGEYPGEAGADWELGATAKPEADEHHGRQNDVGVAGHDKQQGGLRDQNRGTYSQPKEDGSAGERTPHQDSQHGADVRGRASMIQSNDDLPEGLVRERKVPLDKNLCRNEAATQVPKNWNPKEGRVMPKPPTKVSAVKKSGQKDDHDPNDIGQQSQTEASQGVVRDGRGQEQPADKKRAQQTSEADLPQVSQSGQSSGYSSSGEKKKKTGGC